MATPYTEIYDLALVSIQDYLIDKLAATSEVDFLNYLEGFLVRGLVNFINCKKNLEDRDDDERKFNETLDSYEKGILADWLVISYLDKEVLDRRQIMGMMQNKSEANRYSEANLLDKKLDLRTRKYEEVNRKQNLYDLKNMDWSKIVGGNFGN